jgi:hypothetical protein
MKPLNETILAVMFRLFFICLIFIFSGVAVRAQVPDFISLKKRNGITVRNFYANGWPITFLAADGRVYEGPIDKIANDSIFLKFFQVNKWQTIWGTYMYDTSSVYIVPFHYKEIKQIFLPERKRKREPLLNLAKLMRIGGFGYDALNIANTALFYKDNLVEKKNLRNLVIATGVGTTGIVLGKLFINHSTRKYKIVYVNMK